MLLAWSKGLPVAVAVIRVGGWVDLYFHMCGLCPASSPDVNTQWHTALWKLQNKETVPSIGNSEEHATSSALMEILVNESGVYFIRRIPHIGYIIYTANYIGPVYLCEFKLALSLSV